MCRWRWRGECVERRTRHELWECRGSHSGLGGTSMVICLRGECIQLDTLTTSVPSWIRIFIFVFPPSCGTDAVLVYPALLSRIGEWWLFSGTCMLDAHLLCCFQPDPLIGQDALLVGQSTCPLPGSESCCEAVLKCAVCFNNSRGVVQLSNGLRSQFLGQGRNLLQQCA
jgi:hypothetical protein